MNNEIILTLDFPPSANRYWRNYKGKTVKSKEAQSYLTTVGWLARAELGPEFTMIEGDVSISVEFYFPNQRGDLDNRLKVLIDSLNGIAYADDRQITAIKAVRKTDKLNPRCEVVLQW